MLVIFLNSRLGQYHRRFRAVSDSQLTKQGVKAEDFDRLMPVLMAQAEALYAEWPIAA